MKTVAYIRSDDVYYDSRATKEIRALLDAGFRVALLGWERTGRAEEKCREIFREYGEISFRFYPQPMPNGIGIRNAGKLLGWFRWVAAQLKSLPQVDIIHACDLDGALGARRFRRKTGARMVYDIYDYYVDTHANIPGPLRALVEKAEIGVIDRADLVIICTEERKEQIAKARPRRLIVVHNSPELPALPECGSEYDYVYCGNLGAERLCGEILRLYGDNADLRFYLAGLGTFAQEAEALARRYERLEFGGVLSYDRVLEAEAKSVCLSAVYDPSWRNHRLCAPNKFYEALALGKPLIVCRGTGIDRIVEENRVGTVIGYRADEFYRAVRHYAASPEECEEIRHRARALYEANYRWQAMRERLVDAYRTL